MMKYDADFILALETGVKRRIHFDSVMGDFYRHDLVVILQVARLENGRHASAAKRLHNSEAAIQHGAGTQGGGASGGWPGGGWFGEVAQFHGHHCSLQLTGLTIKNAIEPH